MEDRAKKVAENVEGPFYVEDGCIQCGNCAEVAPENFTQGEKYYYVCKQPENDEEISNCLRALWKCPAEAIMEDE